MKRMKKGDFKTLMPFVDVKGIIRVGGRVKPSLVSYDNTRPALLPRKHWISVLVTRDVHRICHSGVDTTTARTRRKYFGPIKVKIGRNTTMKHYGVIFTCMNTRAIHCELAVDASAMDFLQVLRRFFAYRGYPKMMLSDNGLQMVGAENELKAMIEGWDKNKLKEYCADRGITWQFTTPLAPHQNGCSESMVKSCKLALKKAIGDTLLTPFELYTCLLEVANLLNQRPIGKLSQDPDDGAYLCPNDILLGRATNDVPQGPFRETKNPRH